MFAGFLVATVPSPEATTSTPTTPRPTILTGLIEGRDVAVPTAPLAVGLGVVGVEVVASGDRAFSRSDNLNAHYTKTHSKRGGRNRYVATLDETSH
jgi:hypothetical protein